MTSKPTTPPMFRSSAAGKKIRPGSSVPSNVSPTTEHERRQLQALDTASEQAGFPSRETASQPVVRRRRQPASTEPMHNLCIRAPISNYNRFVNFCVSQNLPYWQGMAKLMDLCRVTPDGDLPE